MNRHCISSSGLVLLLTGMLAFPTSLAAQATTFGAIVGRVVDPSGASVPGAAIKVTNVETNVSREVITDNTGDYAVRSLIPGFYSIEVTAQGFQRQTVEKVKLDVAQTLRQDFQLVVGQVTEAVEVAAVAPLLTTEEGTIGTVIDNTKVLELPLNGRDFNHLTRLVPGAVRGANGGGPTIQSDTYAVTGGRSDTNYYSLDGMFNNGTFFKTAAIHPSIDAIQEFKIQTNTSARYGAAAGANINIAIRSGTNDLHGSLFEFIRNDHLDSRDYFAQTKPTYQRNNFGFTIGGPVVIPKLYSGKNRTFWFFNYEALRERRAVTQTLTIPTPAMVAGDLSRTLTGEPAPQIFNPLSAREVGGQIIRDPFPGNIIPPSLIQPYSTAYAQFWFPTDLIPNTTANYINNNKRTRDDNQVNVRIDQKISEKNNLFGRFSWADLSQINPQNMPKAFQERFNTYHGFVLNDTHVFSPTVILDLRGGYLRNNLGEGPTTRFIDVYRQAGITNTPEKFRDYDFPINFGISGFTGPGIGNLVNGPDFIYQGAVGLTKMWGRHTISTGFDYTRLRIIHDSVFSTFNFDNIPSADPQNVARTGQSMASFLLGLPSTANRIVGETDLDIRHDLYHAYIQDDIKVTPRLTVNAGLRYEYNQWPHHIRGRLSGFDMFTGQFIWASRNPVTGEPPNVRPEIGDPRFLNFAPRFGFAYRISDKTVVRSAYGIFYNSNFSWEWSTSRGGWPFSVSDNITGLNIGLNLQRADQLFATFDPSKVVPQNQHTVARDVQTPYMQNWNFGIEHQLAQDLLLELNYQGSKGTHLASFLSTNDAPPGPGDPNPRRPFPSGGSLSELKTVATSKYHGLTTKVEKRFSSGFSMLGSYAWQKSIDLNSQFGGTSPQINTNIKSNLGLSDFDQRHVANISYIWQLPFARNLTGAPRIFLDGWEVSGITTLETGRPFHVSVPFDNANVGSRGNFQRANLVGDPFPNGFNQQTGPAGVWFNTDAFAVPERFTYGNLGRNTLRGPSFTNWDFGVYKNFPVREGVRIQFRSEFFNLFNNTNFGNPNGNITQPNFGKVLGTVTIQRQIQFGLKLVY
jgi:Carboxypeptidase regulatory-like domain